MAEKTTNGKRNKKIKLIALSSVNKEYQFKDPLSKTIQYKGEKVEIKLFEDLDGFSYVLWRNKKLPIEIIEKKQNYYTIMLNGVWHSFSVETPFSLKRKKYLESKEGPSSSITITAPMPGKIVDLLVEVGSEVNAGEPVLILEAMKMQNEITCHIEGIVKSISVKKNESVMKDDLLIEIDRT